MMGIARTRAERLPQFYASKKDANVSDPMTNDDYSLPLDDDESFEKHQVRLNKEESEELRLIVRFYSELWRIQGKRKKAKVQTVLRRAARNFMGGFWDWLAKGRPETAEQRERVVNSYLEGIAEKLGSEPKQGARKKKK